MSGALQWAGGHETVINAAAAAIDRAEVLRS